MLHSFQPGHLTNLHLEQQALCYLFLYHRSSSRTLTAVHDAILQDLVYPAEIVGKRIRVKLDGSRLIKVYVCVHVCVSMLTVHI